MPDVRSIVLARHGRPDLPAELGRAITGRDIGHWYRRYDESGIADHADPPAGLREAAAAAGCVVASDARRALETAARLGVTDRVRVEPVLREVGFPESLAVPVRLSPNVWVLIARATQTLGCCACDEPVPASRARAAIAADTLTRLADEHGTLLVIGHGWFNRFVARELRRRGWSGPRWPPTGYWSTATYQCPPAS
ncbi:MAG: histidine phosphatase family protein [Vicinamibacteraceae bacterium]